MAKLKYKTIKNDFPIMEQGLKAVKGKDIKVGIFDGELAWLASIHEYGCRIKITPKMRKWLHANGLHVKDTTTEIVIPERSFLRSGFDENHKKVIDKAENLLDLVIHGQMSEDEFFETVGILLRDKIHDYAVDLKTPPKHPFTLKSHPGKTNPLVVSGDMVNAIEYRVE